MNYLKLKSFPSVCFLAVLRGSFLVPVGDDVDGDGDGGDGLVPYFLTPLVVNRRINTVDRTRDLFIQ